MSSLIILAVCNLDAGKICRRAVKNKGASKMHDTCLPCCIAVLHNEMNLSLTHFIIDEILTVMLCGEIYSSEEVLHPCHVIQLYR